MSRSVPSGFDDAKMVELAPYLFMVPYKKAALVYGNIGPHLDLFRKLEGKWNGNISRDRDGCCWVFPVTRWDEIIAAFKGGPGPKKVGDVQAEEETDPEETQLSPDVFMIERRGKLWVYGRTYPDRQKLKDLGGQWNPRSGLDKRNCCWVFEKSDRERLLRAYEPAPHAPAVTEELLVERVSKLGKENLALMLDFSKKGDPNRSRAIGEMRAILIDELTPLPSDRKRIIEKAMKYLEDRELDL